MVSLPKQQQRVKVFAATLRVLLRVVTASLARVLIVVRGYSVQVEPQVMGYLLLVV
jgi:hypothetical protein